MFIYVTFSFYFDISLTLLVSLLTCYPAVGFLYCMNSEGDQRMLKTSLAKYQSLPPVLQTKYLFHRKAASSFFL